MAAIQNDFVWTEKHKNIWAKKRILRRYYEEEFFDRIVSMLPGGRSLELGAGPGFFSDHHRCDVVTDITDAPHVDQIVDAHSMPFEDGSFSAVVGVDIVHHFHHPAKALREVRRVLGHGGKLILIEPWTSPFGYFFYRFVHHEDCFPIEAPWGEVFSGSKNPMDGNATIPKTLFSEQQKALENDLGLKVVTLEPFGCLGYIATGGFSSWVLPEMLAWPIIATERRVPSVIWKYLAIKALIVAEAV